MENYSIGFLERYFRQDENLAKVCKEDEGYKGRFRLLLSVPNAWARWAVWGMTEGRSGKWTIKRHLGSRSDVYLVA